MPHNTEQVPTEMLEIILKNWEVGLTRKFLKEDMIGEVSLLRTSVLGEAADMAECLG